MGAKLSVSVVIPTYNERQNVEILIPELHETLKGRPHEILVVDDRSPDGTGAAVLALAKTIPNVRLITKARREGIGAALRRGYDEGRCDILLSTDADLSFSTADVLKLIDGIESGSDLVLGCRHADGGRYLAPTLQIKLKHAVSMLGNMVVRAVTGLAVRDYSANFRAIRRDVWNTILTQENTNSLLLEMVIKVARVGRVITEVPVTFDDRRFGKSKLNLWVEAPKSVIRLMWIMLHKSSGAPTSPRTALGAAVLLLALHAALGVLTIFSLSQTYDEAVHLASGYAFWRSGEYKVDAILNNPLPRLIAALPLLRSNPDPFLQDPAYAEKRDFAYADRVLNGNRLPAQKLLNSARLFLFLVMSPLLGWVLFLWARQIGGDTSGLAALFLYAFNPVILSLSTLVTGDFTAAAFVFLCLCFFAKAVKRARARLPLMLLAGLLLGLALGSKHSAVILLPLLALSYALYRRLCGRAGHGKFIVRECLLVILGAVLALTFVYGPRQLPLWWAGLSQTLALAKNGGGRIAYLLGEVSGTGWWYYFPLVFLMKTPIAMLLLCATAVLSRTIRDMRPQPRGELLAFVGMPAAVIMGAACFSKFQIGIRHILPILPLCCLIAGVAAARLWRSGGWKRWSAGLLLAWYAIGTVSIHPHHLAYFNEAVGGPRNGYKLLVDSNLDWGQELKALGALLKENGNPPIYLSYFGTADPHAYGISYVPVVLFCEFPRPGDAVEPFRAERKFFAVSATNRVSTYFSDKSLMTWLDAYTPYAVLGHTLFVYDFTEQPEALRRVAEILARQGDSERALLLARWLDGGGAR